MAQTSERRVQDGGLTVTHKDRILIARALTNYREAITDCREAPNGWHYDTLIENLIANELSDDNPRFNRSHFLAVVRGEKALESRPPRA